MHTGPRIPSTEELGGSLSAATQDELQALSEFAAWAERHHSVLATGRRHGIRFGVSPEVAAFVQASVPVGLTGGAIAANLVPIRP